MTPSIDNTQVKICGLTRADDVALAISLGASFLGFIVEAPSKRRLSVSEAARLSALAAKIVPRVAVMVNPDDATLSRVIAEMAPDYIQCHGDETPARVAEIGARFKVKTIKACAVASDNDMKTAETFVGVCDFILFDAKPPAGSDVRGGHGTQIDWSLIKRAPLPKIFALAGGLTADNVARAMAMTRAPIIDVSSGVEASPGVKDASKMTAFMKAIHHGKN